MKNTLVKAVAFVVASVLACSVWGAPRIYNPGFDESIRGWKFPAEYSIAEKGGVNNSKALYVKREKSGKSDGVAWQFAGIEGGKKYKVSCQIKADIVKKGKYKVGAGFTLTIRDSKKVIKNFYPVCCFESTNGEWKTVEYSFTAPENSRTCEIRLGLYPGFLGEAWFDNVKIEEIK